ncbi:hypothetical protein, partial [Caulobacter endophyticus]
MLDARTNLIAAAGAAGLTIGAVGWLIAGGGGAVDEARSALSAVSVPRSAPSDVLPPSAASAQLFGQSAGAGGDPAVTLSGLARMPGRRQALLSIGGKPAVWMNEGERVDGVILREVGGGQVTLDMPRGMVDLRLGESTGAAAVAAAAPAGGPTPSPAIGGDA